MSATEKARASLRAIVYDFARPAMLDIGFQELLVLMVIALLVFGPDKLPELGRRLGRAMREFRRASDEFRTTIETNLHINEDLPLPPSAVSTAPEPAAAPGGEAPAAIAGPAASKDIASPVGESPAGSEAPVEVAVAITEPFCARRGGHLFHRSGCGWAGRIPKAERTALKAATEGWEFGLKPCPVCDPRDPEAVS